MAIDPSTTNIGVAIFESGKLLGTANLSFKDIYDLQKLKSIVIAITNAIYMYEIDMVVVEEPVPTRFSRAVTSLNQVVGAIFAVTVVNKNPITFDWVHNRTVKSTMNIIGKGKEGKLCAIQRAIELHPELKAQNITDHVADAVLVGETYIQLYGDKNPKI